MDAVTSLDLNGWHGGTLYFDGYPVAGVYASRNRWVAYYDDGKPAVPENCRTFDVRADAMRHAESWVSARLALAADTCPCVWDGACSVHRPADVAARDALAARRLTEFLGKGGAK